MEDERLEGDAVDGRVDPADERLDGAARDALDRLAELAHGGVLEEHAGVAQALVLPHRDEVALRRRQRLLEQRRDDVVAAPVGAPRGWARARTGPCTGGPSRWRWRPGRRSARRRRHAASEGSSWCCLLSAPRGRGCAKGGGAREPNGSAPNNDAASIGRRPGRRVERRRAAWTNMRREVAAGAATLEQRRSDR